MRHHRKGRKLSMDKDRRESLLRGLARSLIIREKITTTEIKAKELRPFIEKLITKGRIDSLASRRLVASRLGNDTSSVSKIFKTISPRYSSRPGGYTRIIKLPTRISDSAKMAIIEFVK